MFSAGIEVIAEGSCHVRFWFSVPVKIHVQPELIGKIPLKPFNVDLNVSDM
jgi:hypothetical protein